MLRNSVLLLAAGLCLVPVVVRSADRAPEVNGKWTGTWTIFQPGSEPLKPIKAPMKLDCEVKAVEGGYEAQFEGECGRPYKYKIKMLGREAGSVVLFKGTADLGPMDGGVYDWIGRADAKAFVGFYTSQGYTGTFRLARVPAVTAAK